MDAGAWIHQGAMGCIQRIDDDLFAGDWRSESAINESELGCVDAHIFRVQRDPVYRVARAAVCASVFAGMVRLSREARRVCGLFYEFGDRNEGAQVVVFGVG